MTQKWKSDWLELADAELSVKNNRVWPLRQIATYCRYAETRYGYIITQNELVAIRVRRIGPPNPDETCHAAIEYRSIPWAASGSQKLTVNLAIWALGCMAMNDTHRHMEGPGHVEIAAMARLTSWQASKEKGGYVNVISRRLIKAGEWASLSEGNTVHVDDDAEGQSHTSTFISIQERVPAIPGRAARTQLDLGGLGY